MAKRVAEGEEFDGARIAAQFMRLGRLGRKEGEELVIEVEDDERSPREAWRLDIARAVPHHDPVEATKDCSPTLFRPIVEGDLAVAELCSDDEVSPPPPPSYSPCTGAGRSRGRRLMAARAQTCVVCMEEKEHTLVPPHREPKACGSGVEGHRFCTECWVNFLRHGMWQQRRAAATKAGLAPPPLCCPLCRGVIEVPDVWGQDLDLPASWRPPTPDEKAGSPFHQPSQGSGRRFERTAGLRRQPAQDIAAFWADAARPGSARPSTASSSVSSGSSQASADICAPQVEVSLDGNAEHAEGSHPPSASMWRALTCPMACCFKRLQRAMAHEATTRVEEVFAEDEQTDY